MGLFKKAKKMVKSAVQHPLATAAGIGLSAAIGPAGLGLTTGLTAAGVGSAASMLLSGAGGKKKGPDGADVLVSPMAALPPVTADVALREQMEGQRAAGGAVVGSGADLLGETEVDEVRRKKASRTLLG